jgi:hypothetical protein
LISINARVVPHRKHCLLYKIIEVHFGEKESKELLSIKNTVNNKNSNNTENISQTILNSLAIFKIYKLNYLK